MTDEALGYYCQMDIAEHDGPVAQIFRAGFDQPIWFSQVRDAIAYTRLPEETDEVTAFYVSDMTEAQAGGRSDPIAWVDAEEARFVIGSTLAGGMGAPEAVPFADPDAAATYAASQGGEVVTLAAIPDDYVLAPVEIGVPNTGLIQ
jgi:copper chaperone NosL